MTEPELVRGCLRRDPAVQQELYARTSARIYRLLLGLTRNEEDAADLLQDTYIRAFERIEQFHGHSSLGTWLYRIAINEARQRARRNRRHEEILREEAPPPAEAHRGDQDTADLRIDLDAALARLPDEERTLILLRYFEELDYTRMAEVLERPPGTIASGLNRARRMLQEILGAAPAARP